jgi:hypothetical protein
LEEQSASPSEIESPHQRNQQAEIEHLWQLSLSFQES